MRGFWSGVVMVGAVAVWSVPVASAFCPLGKRWPGPVVDVVLQQNVSQRLCTDHATPCATVPRTALEATIRATLAEYYDGSGANIRLHYAGICTIDTPSGPRPCSDNEFPAGKIVIHATCRGPNGTGDNWDADNDGFADHGYANICTGDGKTYGSYPGQSEVSISVQGILMHELAHAIGFHHPDDCGESGRSVFDGAARPHLMPYDVNNLSTLYGFRVGQAMQAAYSSPFAPTTWAGTGSSVLGAFVATGFGACDDLTRGGTHVAFARNSPRLLNLLTHRDDGTTVGTSVVPSYHPGHVALSTTTPGVACQDVENLRLFWGADSSSGNRSIVYVESSDAGQSWGDVLTADSATTQVHSRVDGAFDPASGLYVYAYRNGASRVTTKVMSEGSRPHMYPRSTSPFPRDCDGDPTASCWRASAAPSVACGDPAALGQYNCLIAWTDTDWNRALIHAAARVVPATGGGHELQLHSVRTGYSSVLGAPSVALDGASDFPWRIAFRPNNVGKTKGEPPASHRVFTRRKAADPAATLQEGGSFTFGGAVTAPALGSLIGSSLGFAKTMIFVTAAP